MGHLPRTALIGLAVLLWALLAAAWLVPPMLDWNRYRADISGLISRELGEDLAINGQVHIVLLPQPLLVVDDVALTDVTDHLTLRARELRLRVAFWPLLAGRVETQELVLRGFSFDAAWPLGPLAGRLHPPGWLSTFDARIEDGTLHIGAATITAVNATLRLLPDSGGMSLAGGMEFAGLPWRVAAHLTQQGGDGSAGFDASLEGMNSAGGVAASFSGQLAADGALRGHASLRGPDLAQITPAPSGAFKLESNLDLRGETARLDDIAAELGGQLLRGSAQVATSAPPGAAWKITTKLGASKLDLDGWLKRLLAPHPAGNAAGPALGADVSLDLTADSASLSGGALRQFHAALDLSPEAAVLRDGSAMLPGAARLALSGTLQRGAVPHFDGKATLNAPALRDTLAWLAQSGVIDTSRLPETLLHSADLRAAIAFDTVTPGTISLTDLNGMIDASHVQGNAALRPGPRLGVSAMLDIDRLTLDPLLPQGWTLAGLPSHFGRTDLDLTLHVQQAAWRGEMLSPVQIEAANDGTRLIIRRIEVMQPGTRLALSGTIAADGTISEGRMELSAAPEAIGTLAPALPAWLATHLPHAPLAVSVQADGPMQALALRATLDLGDLRARAAPLLDLPGGTWRSTWAMRHPGAYRLLDDAGWPETRFWLGEGSFSASGTIAGTGTPWAPTSLHSAGFDIAAGQFRAGFALDVALGDVPAVTGRITADVLPVPLPALRSNDPLRLDALSGWQAMVKLSAADVQGDLTPMLQQATATVSLKDGVLKLDDLTARLAGGSVSGKASFDSAAMPPQASADVQISAAQPPEKLFDLPVDIVGGGADGALSLSASGFSPASLLATLGGHLHLGWRDGSLTGLDLARMGPRLEEADLRAALSDGSTAFQQADINADVQNGALRFAAASFTGPAGRVDVTGLVDLVGRTEELRLATAPALTNPPSIALLLSGRIDDPHRSFDTADAARWRALFAPPPPAPAPAPQMAAPTTASPATQAPAKPPAPVPPQAAQPGAKPKPAITTPAPSAAPAQHPR